jgi:hypothetical protein
VKVAERQPPSAPAGRTACKRLRCNPLISSNCRN